MESLAKDSLKTKLTQRAFGLPAFVPLFYPGCKDSIKRKEIKGIPNALTFKNPLSWDQPNVNNSKAV